MSSDSSSGRPSTVTQLYTGRRRPVPASMRPYNRAMAVDPPPPSTTHARGRVFHGGVGDHPPVAVRGEGSTIWDASGRAYLDAAGGAIVVGIGHGRRSVADTMANQAAAIAYAHGSAFTSEALQAYAAEVGR